MKKSKGGVVYSTNPDYVFDNGEEEIETLENGKQELKIWLDRKGGGKVVSRVAGYIGKESDLQSLKKKLQGLCGTGGSAGEGEVLIQGDHRDKLLAYLVKEGYKAKKAGG
jgi:translation initiation factor 1